MFEEKNMAIVENEQIHENDQIINLPIKNTGSNGHEEEDRFMTCREMETVIRVRAEK